MDIDGGAGEDENGGASASLLGEDEEAEEAAAAEAEAEAEAGAGLVKLRDLATWSDTTGDIQLTERGSGHERDNNGLILR